MTRHLHRSLLFVPGDNARAIQKAQSLPADVVIFDLEDGVAPANKEQARQALLAAVTQNNHRPRRIIVRTNSLTTPWGAQDIKAFANAPIDALMLPKVESPLHITQATQQTKLPIWANIETPSAILALPQITAIPQLEALVAGTNDLGRDLKIVRTLDRQGLLFALSAIVTAARAHKLLVFDGTFTDFSYPAGLESETIQGKTLGFDGKTALHPSQLEIINRVYSPTPEEIAAAAAIVEAYESAIKEHREVILVTGKMIERLHYEAAKELLEKAEMIESPLPPGKG